MEQFNFSGRSIALSDIRTNVTRLRGSSRPRCCRLRNLSRNRFPSGYKQKLIRTLYDARKITARTFSSLKVSTSSSPSCTSISPVTTLCFPNRSPAKPSLKRPSLAALRSATARSRLESWPSMVLRSVLTWRIEASMRFFATRSAAARFFRIC